MRERWTLIFIGQGTVPAHVDTLYLLPSFPVNLQRWKSSGTEGNVCT